ncbi:MAG: hypothetical protein ABI600_04570 [Luteolibacter sp.]
MKAIVSPLIALGALSIFTSCTTVVEKEPTVHTTTTTTDRTSLTQPTSTTTESRVTRSY